VKPALALLLAAATYASCSPSADAKCLAIGGRRAVKHRLLAKNITADCRVPTEGRGRAVEESPALYAYSAVVAYGYEGCKPWRRSVEAAWP